MILVGLRCLCGEDTATLDKCLSGKTAFFVFALDILFRNENITALAAEARDEKEMEAL